MKLFFTKKDEERVASLEARVAELQAKLAHVEKLFPDGDPYRLRLPTFVELGTKVSYCCDCRFAFDGTRGVGCFAHPLTRGDGPEYLRVGEGGLNADHNCQHFQPKDKP